MSSNMDISPGGGAMVVHTGGSGPGRSVPITGSGSGFNPRPVSGSGSNPRPVSGSGSNPRPVSGSGSIPRPVSGSGSNSRGDVDVNSNSRGGGSGPDVSSIHITSLSVNDNEDDEEDENYEENNGVNGNSSSSGSRRRGRPTGCVSNALNPIKKKTFKRGRGYSRISTKITESYLSQINAFKANGLSEIQIASKMDDVLINLGNEELNNVVKELIKIEKEDTKDEHKVYLNNLIYHGESHIKDSIRDFKNADLTVLRNKLSEVQKFLAKQREIIRKSEEVEQLVGGYIDNLTGSKYSIKILRKSVRAIQDQRENQELVSDAF